MVASLDDGAGTTLALVGATTAELVVAMIGVGSSANEAASEETEI